MPCECNATVRDGIQSLVSDTWQESTAGKSNPWLHEGTKRIEPKILEPSPTSPNTMGIAPTPWVYYQNLLNTPDIHGDLLSLHMRI